MVGKILKVRITREHLMGDYGSTRDCPLARALKSKGFLNVVVGGNTLHFDTTKRLHYWIPNYWTPSFVWKLQKSRKSMTVQLTSFRVSE